jgi:spore coat assembly protein SafA
MSSVSSVGPNSRFATIETDTYVVKHGDTLWDIARAHGVSLAELEAANPQIRNPDLIYPGDHVNLPAGHSTSSNGNGNGSGGVHAEPTSYHGGSPPAALQGRIDQAMRYFESQGWTRAQAAGIVANLQAESGLQNGIQQHGGGPGYGLAQWEGPRQAAFRQWAGHDIHGSSFDEQLGFIQYELTHSESGAGNALRRATSAGDAAQIVTRLYERPADTAGQSTYRAGLARQIYGSSAP